MVVVRINGHNGHNGLNGHNKHDTEPVERVELDEPKPCCVRLGNGSWCNRPDGHSGDHEGATPEYGPLEARPRLWREHRGLKK
jgi:hypothetical protein